MALPPELSTPKQQAAYAYVLGQYLGDGCLDEHRRAVFRLRTTCSNDWPLVIDRVRLAMQTLLPANSVCVMTKEGCAEVGLYSKRWPVLLPQHGRGPKHLRTLSLADWQAEIVFEQAPAEFVSALLHSDGCRAVNRVCANGRDYANPRYFFSNRSEDIKLDVPTCTGAARDPCSPLRMATERRSTCGRDATRPARSLEDVALAE